MLLGSSHMGLGQLATSSFVLLLAALASGCAAPADEAESSEAAVTEGGFTMLGALHTPKQVLLPVQINDRGFAAQFYDAVDQINKTEKLSGTEGPNAAIALVGWLAKEDQTLLGETPESESKTLTAKAVLAELEGKIRKSRGLAAGAPIPNFSTVRSDGSSNHAFLQDIFEMVAVNKPGPTQLVLLDLAGQGDGPDPAILNQAFAKHFKTVPLPAGIAPKPGSIGGDDDGGNLEVTHEGRPYVGSRTSAEFRAFVKRVTGQAPIVLPTDWLFVGHVDEYLTILPSTDECGATLVHADPLEAINVMRQRKAVPLIPQEDFEGNGTTSRDAAAVKQQFDASLAHFTRPGSEKKETLTLADFDRTKPVRDFAETPNLDIEFLGNLHAKEEIDKGVAELQKNSKCLKKVVALPSLYFRSMGAGGNPDTVADEIATGYTTITGYINLVSLRNHVIISKERKEFFGPIVRERLGAVLGDKSRVHEVDASFFEVGSGSVHCTTNVIRSNELWRK
jgi:hypothetical protein